MRRWSGAREVPVMPAARRRLPIAERAAPDFAAIVGELRRAQTTTLQINVGKLCNQACHHCHVEAGPKRTEIMSRAVAARAIDLLATCPQVATVDLTGGAPELNPSFRWLVEQARRLGRRVIDRCNLTILLEPGLEDLAEFLAAHDVEIVASLPCYSESNVEEQRGHGVFAKSIAALRRLNELGYGRGAHALHLVYNPNGAFLPPAQAALEARYKAELAERFEATFDHLYTITNVPIARYADYLDARGKYDEYMSLLVAHVNPATVPGLMCRSLVSVGWDGQIYDCDFNQMLELPLGGARTTLFDIESLELEDRSIATGSHCFACTAGAGSSCGGSLV
jgi:radical SAM/Cys-rich protein